MDLNRSDSVYKEFDIPEVLEFIFHPRPDYGGSTPEGATDLNIFVEKNVYIGARLFKADEKLPFILFFHGNGEIASDYDDLGPVYNQLGMNFMVVDYRGYGKSSGQPTVDGMMYDCIVIFDYVKGFMAENNFSGSLIVMGRSLGSASVCEIAEKRADQFDGLIIESGFSSAIQLIERLGAKIPANLKDSISFDNSRKIAGFNKPVQIIHAEYDHIIPYSDAKELLASLPDDTDKKLLKIREADHNSIFYYGMNEYLEAVLRLSMKGSIKI